MYSSTVPHLASVVLLASVAALPAQVPAPPPAAVAVVEHEGYPILNAAELLKPEVLKGPHHLVLDPVPTEGFANQYTVQSDWGTFTVRGNSLLKKRIREFDAIARLEHASKSEEFQRALKSAAAKPFHMAGKALQDPGAAVKGIGAGAKRFFNRASEAIERGGNKSAQTDNAAQSLIGFSAAKRDIAYHLKVDPYTDNPVLQKRLDDMAWASFGGGFAIKAGTFMVGGGVGTVVGGLSTAEDVAQSVRDNSPVDLSKLNREALVRMGISGLSADAFVEHPNLTPSQQTVITSFLGRLGEAKGREVFLKMVMTSKETADVLFFVHCAEMMVLYHEKVSPVHQVLDLYGLPAIYAENRALILPLAVDYGSWSAEADRLSLAIAGYQPQVEITQRVLYVAGRVTPLARAQFEARGFIVSDEAQAELYK